MSYKLSFGDGDAESAFFDWLDGYVVEIQPPNLGPTTYRIEGPRGWDEARGMTTLPVRLWDETNDQVSEDTAVLYLTGEEEIHIF